ncbi:lytic transglycosylase domain-containing protein [Spirosoma sp. KUDC1026]|nr:lytic transglycosylase domain-containing protein [Spirosoma sp. KUDC1026]
MLAVLALCITSLGQSGFAQKKPSKLPRRHPATNHGVSALGNPARLHFCGEVVPTEQGTVSSKLALALAGSSGYVRHVRGLKARSAPFFTVIEPILRKHSIPNDFKYLPLIESAWQANAVSSAGAVGYWQFMDETALDMGLSITPSNDERTDLRKSTEAACRYLKFLHQKLGSWTLVAAAYNGGVGMVQRKIVRAGHRNYYAMAMNPETGYYLYRILAMKELFTNPSYGVGSVGMMLADMGNPYEQEREQARRMGWLQDEDPEPVGVPVESLADNRPPQRSEAVLMDSLLSDLLKQRAAHPTIFMGDVTARLLKAGMLKVGQSWAFTLTEDVQIDETQLHKGDFLYALIDDIDRQGNIFFRATKAVTADTNATVSLSLLAINPATGLAGVPKPRTIQKGWQVDWKL